MTQQAAQGAEHERADRSTTQDFVRYSPGIEHDDPNFEQSLQVVLEGMKTHMRASPQAEGGGRVVRDAHAKGFGLARAEVEILSDLPTPYAQGIYSTPGAPKDVKTLKR